MENRMSIVEAGVKNLDDRMERFMRYMQEDRKALSDDLRSYMQEGGSFREKLVSQVAVMSKTVDDCTTAHHECEEKIEALDVSHNGRIGSLENSRAKALGINIGVSGTVSAVLGCLGALVGIKWGAR